MQSSKYMQRAFIVPKHATAFATFCNQQEVHTHLVRSSYDVFCRTFDLEWDDDSLKIFPIQALLNLEVVDIYVNYLEEPSLLEIWRR